MNDYHCIKWNISYDSAKMNTIRKFSSLGCSLRGIQSLLRNRNGIENRLFDDDLHSDGYYWRYEAIEDLNHNGIHINQLPDELLIKIFSYMTARTLCHCVLPVCRLWYKLGNDPVLWTWLDFSYRNENTHVTMVKTVSLRFQFMSSMTLKNFRSPDEMERMLFILGSARFAGLPRRWRMFCFAKHACV